MPDPARKTVSATEMSALFGASKYDTPFTIYHRLVGNSVEKKEDNRMQAGNRFEGPVVEWAAEQLEVAQVVRNRDANGQQRYLTRDRLGCHRDADMFDANRGGWGALETKMVFDYRVWMDEWGGGETPPKMHEIQLQQQMYVGTEETGPFKWGTLTACMGGQLFHFPREPLPELWAAMDKAANDMFENIALQAEPDPTGLMIEHPLLNKLYPPIKGKVLDLSALVDPAVANEEEKAENLRRLKYLDIARADEFHGEQKLFHEKAAKDSKERLRSLAMDNGTVLLPYGAKIETSIVNRAAYSVKASSYSQVKVYIPQHLPDDFMKDYIGAELGA